MGTRIEVAVRIDIPIGEIQVPVSETWALGRKSKCVDQSQQMIIDLPSARSRAGRS